MFLLRFNLSIVDKSSVSVTVDGRWIISDFMPTSDAYFDLFLTYIWDAGFSPTIITVSCGGVFICAISDFRHSRILDAQSFPSNILAIFCVLVVIFIL